MKTAVVGLGYVGLPLAIRLSQLNFDVLGVDVNSQKITKLQKGTLPFAESEPQLKDYFKKEYKKGKMSFSKNFENISKSEMVFISVDTPIIGKVPNYKSLKSAINAVGANLKKGTIVVIESTVAPNTCKKLIIPTLEKKSKLKINKDFFVATVPERIRPNHIFEQLNTLSRVIGVSDAKIKKNLKDVYSKITSGEIDFTDLTTAETVKTVENSFRDVNIAFANEVAIACEEIGVDVWRVRELVNKSQFHNMHQPGAGVGGHCIPKDPWLLASSVKVNRLNLIETARKINDRMPAHIFALAREALKEKKIKITNANFVILGYSYVGNSDDTRNSPTESLIKILKNKKVKYVVHDPHVKDFLNQSVESIVKGADMLIIMVNHDEYRQVKYKKVAEAMKTKIIIDGRNLVPVEIVKKLGFVYKGVGNNIV